MAITNTTELAAAVADFLNRDDVTPIMDTLIDNAQDRILYDQRFRGELTEKVIKKTRSEYDKVNPLRVSSFWDDVTSAELSDVSVEITDPDTQVVTVVFPPADPDSTLDMDVFRLYIDDVEYTKVTDYSTVLEAYPNEYVYCEVGGKYYLSGWEIEDIPSELSGSGFEITLVGHQKTRIKETVEFDTTTGGDVTVNTSSALKQQPNLFLYATLVEAAVYLRDTEYLPVYQARYEELFDKLAKDWKRKQISSGFGVTSVGSDKRI
jgi:hypothetical protein